MFVYITVFFTLFELFTCAYTKEIILYQEKGEACTSLISSYEAVILGPANKSFSLGSS